MAEEEKTLPFREVLLEPEPHDDKAWLYLPAEEKWRIDSTCAVLRGEEVPPELEDDPEADVPAFARQHGLMPALPVSTVKEIVENARLQRKDVDLQTLFTAFLHYYDNDAFVEL